MAFVSRLAIYPVKSCDVHLLPQVTVLPSGPLGHDRQFALVDAEGKLITAKRIPLIHRLRFQVDPIHREYSVSRVDNSDALSGHLDERGQQLSDWLTDFFSLDVSIIENDKTGFPDDAISPGPTIVSTATLQTVTSWFPGLTVDEVRQRFRANIEVDGVEPFWEDRLFRADKQPQPFQVGSTTFGGINPCQRCVVPTRHPLTGEIVPASFAQEFAMRREQSLPAWSPREQFTHFYRLTTNTILLDRGIGVIQIGDPVEILD